MKRDNEPVSLVASLRSERFRIEVSDGVSLNIFCWGDSMSPTVLLCNAVGMSADIFQPLALRLASSSFVVTWESRCLPELPHGHEQSIDVCLTRQVDDSLEVLNHFGIERAAVVGWCSGARVALALPHRWGGAVSALALLNGGYSLAADEFTKFEHNMATVMPRIAANRRYAELFHQTVFSNSGDGVNTMSTAMGAGPAWADAMGGSNAEAIEEMISLPYRSPEHLYQFARLSNAFLESRLDLDDLPQVPTLVLTCVQDATTSPLASQRIAEAFGNAEFAMFPLGDHFSLYWNSEYMTKLAKYLYRFR